jgi:hypothetical protein
MGDITSRFAAKTVTSLNTSTNSNVSFMSKNVAAELARTNLVSHYLNR